MTTIHKYPLEVKNHQTILMPTGAQILSVQFQEDQLVLWAIVNDTLHKEGRLIEIYRTGTPFQPLNRKHISTVQEDCVEGVVWHIFEILG